MVNASHSDDSEDESKDKKQTLEYQDEEGNKKQFEITIGEIEILSKEAG